VESEGRSGGLSSGALSPNRVFLVSLVVPLLFLAIALATLKDYGETWDEQFDQNIGRYYYNDWKSEGAKGLERFIPLQRNYGPFYDVVIVATRDLVVNKLKLMTDEVAAHHLAVVFVSAFALWLVFRVGFAFWGLFPALLAQVLLVLMPQFLGHGHNNLKDTPLMAFFMLSLLLMRRAARDGRLRWWAVAGVATGLTYAIKIHAVFVPIVVVVWQAREIRGDVRRWLRLGRGLAVSGVTAFATILAAWPYYRIHPIERFLETYRTFKDHQYNELVFYLGRHVFAHEVPWHFPFVMLGVNTPLVLVGLFLLGLVLLAVRFRRRGEESSGLVFAALWFFVPVLAQILSRAAMLDGVRHYVLVFPAIALLGGYAGVEAGRRLLASGPNGRRFAAAWASLLALALALLVRTLVALHPYEVVFFNRLAGGTKGARENFELDYWGVSFKQAAAWMNANLPDGTRVLLTMQAQHFLHVDSGRLHFVPDLKRRPNVKVNLIRGILKSNDPDGGDYLHPSKKPIYAVTAGGANLLEIFDYPQNADLPDGSALEPARAAAPGRLLPGLLGQVYADADFAKREGGPFDFSPAAFDCANNPYNGRAASIRATGFLVVEKDGLYAIQIQSDDDAVLYLNGRAALPNDSGHTTLRRFRLKAGLYDARLDYRNDVGGACLAVTWGDGADERPALRTLAAPAIAHEP
jgi:hypothetical protein